MHFICKNYILLTAFLSILCHSKTLINFRLFKYQNDNDILYNGVKCETFHWANDYCDPMFEICISSTTKCHILNITVMMNNKKRIENVFYKTIEINNVERSLLVEVKVDDHDRHGTHGHIARFRSQFNISQLNTLFSKQLEVFPMLLNVRLRASVTVKCATNYYGENCDLYCQPKIKNYRCDPISGLKRCLLNCGLHGSCDWNVQRNEFLCNCNDSWTGDFCQFRHFDNCSLISCRTNCTASHQYMYCNCTSPPYVETCQENLLTTSTVKESMTTITMLTNTDNQSEYLTSKSKDRQSTEIRPRNRVAISQTSNAKKENISEPPFTSKQQSSSSSMTIVIICLVLFICISIFLSAFIICKCRKKQSVDSMISQRPLPPIVYEPKFQNGTNLSSIFANIDLPNIPQFGNDLCTIESDCYYESPLIRFNSRKSLNDGDIYEEPISHHNRDGGSDDTVAVDMEDNTSEQYQKPISTIYP